LKLSSGRLTVEEILSGATPEHAIIIKEFLDDEAIMRLDKYIDKNVLWNCDAFVDKVGFSERKNAFRHARKNGLIKYDVPLSRAVGLRSINGISIVNPLPKDIVVPPRSRTQVKYMGTWDILEWVSGAQTDRSKGVRNALWWLCFMSDRERMKAEISELEGSLENAKKKVSSLNLCIT
jgi:hypothetical protein